MTSINNIHLLREEITKVLKYRKHTKTTPLLFVGFYIYYSVSIFIFYSIYYNAHTRIDKALRTRVLPT